MARQSDGRYRAKVTVGKDMNGGSVIKYVSGRTKKAKENLIHSVFLASLSIYPKPSLHINLRLN